MYNRIEHFIEEHNIIYKYQFGFRKNIPQTMLSLALSNKLTLTLTRKILHAVYLSTYKKLSTLSTINTFVQTLSLWNQWLCK